MVKMIKSGTLDFIGCARPSIADPLLPKKVEEGRIEDNRERIGRSICITGDMTMSISRCTQNPTFMEEWRKGVASRTHACQGRQRADRRRRPRRAGLADLAGYPRIVKSM